VPPVCSTKEAVLFSSCHGHLSTALIDNLPANRSKCIATFIDCTTELALYFAIGTLEGM
jgi:hypothetical protein